VAEQFHFHPEHYDELVRAEVPRYDELQATVAGAAGEVAAARILDLGTGTGETLVRVAARHPGAELIGIDESDGMLAVARERMPDADLRVARLQDPLPEGPFDLVVSALAVHHLDATEKADLFRRIAARLAPGGRFVLGDVVVPDDPADAVAPLDPGYDRPSRADEQLRWLADAGLRPALRWSRQDLAVLVGDRPPA
jgi:tRNA (cmo5U34)-methyltransferase